MTVILQLVYTSIFCKICAHIIYVQNFLQRPVRLPTNHNHFIERNSHCLSSVAMVSKRRHDHLKAARKASVALFKKRRSESSLFPTLDHCKINDNKLSTTNTSNMEDDSQTWFWNESANKSNLDSEEEDNHRSDEDDENLEEKHSKTKEETSCEVLKQELKWNKKGERSLCRGYGSGSKSTKKRKKKTTWELEKKTLKSYNILVLWQQSRELAILSAANSHDGLGQSPKPLPIDPELPASSLSDVSWGGGSILSKHEIFKNQRILALNDLSKLLESVKAQEKKYGGNMLSPYSNYYRWHLMVQQFLQAQLTIRPSQTRHDFSRNVAQSFGRGIFIAQNNV